MPTITTTLNKIRSFSPCKQGWEKLLASLNKTQADDEPLNYLQILESNGLQDTIWCMRCEWFENKEVWMQFVAICKEAADDAAAAAAYAAADAASAADAAADDAAYAAYVAANDAAYAAYVATADAASAAYATAYDAAADAAAADAAERTRQANFLRELLS